MVPNGWSLKLISDTSKVITGNTPSTKIREYYGGNIPFVSPADLGGSKHISVATKKLTVEGFKKARSIRAGSTLFTCIGSTIGKLGMSATEVATNQQINAVVPYDKFDDDFIYYQLELRAVFIAKLAGTQAVPIINKTTFESQSLLVPDSLPEQRKIAKILSTWDKAISTTERLIDNSKQQKKALMQQLLTGKKRLLDDSGKPFEGEWEEVKLGEISHITTGSSNREDSSLDGEYTFFDRSEDIRTSSRYLFDSEAVIVPGEGQDFVPKHFEGKFDLHQRTYAIMNFDGCVGRFLFYYIGYHRHYFLAQAVGSTVKSLRLPMFQKMPINLPNQLEQAKIASVLNNADREIKILQQQLADLKQEKKALMQQLLTGKRRVKVDDKEVA